MLATSKRLALALSHWRQWPVAAEPVLKDTFHSGLNHHVVRLQHGADTTVLKLFSQPAPLAVQAQQHGATLGIAPAVLYHDTELNYCLMEYVDAKASAPLANNNELEPLAKSLATLHRHPIPAFAAAQGLFDIPGWSDYYLKQLGKHAPTQASGLQQALQMASANPAAPCFCHNDLVSANCFLTQQGAQFIDWEFAQLNSALFDLAALAVYRGFSEQQTDLLLHCYDPKLPVRAASPLFIATEVAVLWLDTLWHLLKGKQTVPDTRLALIDQHLARLRSLQVPVD